MGFYNHLNEMLEKCISENFMSQKHREMWSFVDSPEEVISAISNAPKWDTSFIEFAIIK